MKVGQSILFSSASEGIKQRHLPQKAQEAQKRSLIQFLRFL
jgi:hypothetical protein